MGKPGESVDRHSTPPCHHVARLTSTANARIDSASDIMAERQWWAVAMWSGGQNLAHCFSEPKCVRETIGKYARIEIYFRQSHHVMQNRIHFPITTRYFDQKRVRHFAARISRQFRYIA